MFERFSDGTREVLVRARMEARSRNEAEITPEHLLLGLLADPVVERVLHEIGARSRALCAAVTAGLRVAERPGSGGMLPLSSALRGVLDSTIEEVVGLGHREIDPAHLLIALVKEDEGLAASVLAAAGATIDATRCAVLECLAEVDGTSTL